MSLAAAPPQEQQLTLEVGFPLSKPDQSTFKISGGLASSKKELYGEDKVRVMILDEDGELLVESEGLVEGITFKKHRPANQKPWVERVHTITLGADG